MSVDSINPNGSRIQTHEKLARRAEEKRVLDGGKAQSAKTDAGGSSDRVEISDAAKLLAGGVTGTSSKGSVTGTLSAERIAQITERISEGYYDRPEVRDTIARRVIPDLLG